MIPHLVPTRVRISNVGVENPSIIYGTAWKKERTTELVIKAVKSGFRGIDTACQPKHYREDLVGDAISTLLSEKIVKRDELFIQTKFTPISGQDENNVPYDRTLSLREQVKSSYLKSIENLKIQIIDSLVLHSPLSSHQQTMEVWKSMEELQIEGKVRQLGLSNCYSLHDFSQLYNAAIVKPSVLQNRFYSDTKFDYELRAFCIQNNVLYQSFWTLTANIDFICGKLIADIARKYSKRRPQIFYRFVMQMGITPLSGTTSDQHMIDDLDLFSFSLTNDEVELIYNQLTQPNQKV